GSALSRWTLRHSITIRASRSANSVSSASSRESSTISTRSTATSAFARGLVEHRPELAQRAHGLEELVDIDRLHHVGIDAEVPAARKVVLFARGRQDHHRHALEALVLARLGEDLQAVHARHLDVEQQHGRVALDRKSTRLNSSHVKI